MKKKELKQRIKELEAENLMLRAMALNPVYIYLYAPLPYNPYWKPYQWNPIGPVTCEPIWKITDTPTWYVGDSGNITKTYLDDTSKYTVGVGWGYGNDVTVVSTGDTVEN